MAIWLGEIIISILILALAVVFYMASSSLPPNINPIDIGAAGFPVLMAVVIVLLAITQIIISLRNKGRSNGEKAEYEVLRLTVAFVSVLVYFYSITRVGFFVATPMILLFLMYIQGNRKYLQMLMVTASFTLFSYVVFLKVLNVPLP